MREILFKAKSKRGNKWVYGHYWFNAFTQQHYLKCLTEGGTQYEDIEVIPETVCQFTGLTDKNGNNIFEGDKVRYRNSTKYCEVIGDYLSFEGVIEYWVGQTGVGYRYKSGRYTMMIKRGQSFSFEIIGNIHD